MEVLSQTPNVKITGKHLQCGLYRFAMSSSEGSFVSLSPESFDRFINILHQYPNIETIYRLVPQLGGSTITMQYNKDKEQLCVTYTNERSTIKESKIILTNEDLRIIKHELPSKQKIPFLKNMEDEGFDETGTFKRTKSL